MAIPLAGRADTFAIVDRQDAPRVLKYRWSAQPRHTGDCYAVAKIDGKQVAMHRLILGAWSGEEVDHENRNGLDNRRSNLRSATRSQNLANRNGWGETSKFKGVCRKGKRWQAYIGIDGKQHNLGTFDDPVDAAIAYDEAAFAAFGEFALLNMAAENDQ